MIGELINSGATAAESKNGTNGGTTKTHVKSASISSASGASPLSADGAPHNASARDLAQPRPRYLEYGSCVLFYPVEMEVLSTSSVFPLFTLAVV